MNWVFLTFIPAKTGLAELARQLQTGFKAMSSRESFLPSGPFLSTTNNTTAENAPNLLVCGSLPVDRCDPDRLGPFAYLHQCLQPFGFESHGID
jgi:hypothetical protein